MLDIAWVIPLIPAASFFLILLFGKRMPFKGAEIGIFALGLCFAMAVVTNVQWFQRVDDAEHAAHATSGAEATDEHAASDAATTEHATESHADAEGDEATESPSSAAEEHDEGGAAAEGGAAVEESHAGDDAHESDGGEDDHAEAGGAGGGHTEFEVEPVRESITWWSSGGIDFSVGMLLDGPAVMMLFVVTLISLLVHIYSTDYVGGDRRYTHYFAFLSLFSASMLGLIMSENTLQLLTCWELVGLCSFALIGHWWEEKPNSDAALKAFITNRVGDVGLICGVIVLFFGAGQTFDIVTINEMAVSGEISHLVLLVGACSLLAAVMSKSGQFILHTWLPDAMAGPTPVSALIHAATMVVAGIFMVGRLYPVFFQGLSIGVSGVNLLAVIGGVTVIGGAGLAFVQTDIKKVLAYSTVSQLGYMAMALGVGAWTAAFFHLFTHAMFKAGLFLGSGSVAHSVHSFDMKEHMGGMKRFMPKTYWTFVISTGALIGLFPLACFWSKDEILAGAEQLGTGYTAFLVVGLIGAFMTAAYMTRCVYLTFHGEPRGHAADAAHPPHESGPRIVVPLYILSGMAVLAGFTNLPNTGALDFVPDSWALRFEHFYEPKGEYFPSVLDTFSHPEFNIGIAIGSTIIGLLGIGLAAAWYFRGLGPHGLTERNKVARAGHRVLVEKYYLDRLYTDIIVGAVKGPIAKAAYWFNQKGIDGVINGAGTAAVRGGQFVYDKIDQGVVDTIVNGSGAAAEGSGQGLRQMQTGRVQQYAALLFAGAAILAGIFIIVI
ncbi:MAG: NADH-quinone oxidoreductase subunit L [Acidimicrobiales bacterium]|nr:NADH-quinone oxidoreductase subunit L [Acidimicrobiales bacterium]